MDILVNARILHEFEIAYEDVDIHNEALPVAQIRYAVLLNERRNTRNGLINKYFI